MDISKIKNITIGKNQEDFDFEATMKKCLVDLATPIPFPPVAMSIGLHENNLGVYDNPTFTYGEMSLIKAKKKSKKTFFKTALVASYIGGNSSNFFPNIKTRRNQDLYVFDFDTEQGTYYAQRAFRRIEEMTGFRYKNYLPFSIQSILDKKKRILFIDYLLNHPSYKNKIGLMIIDQIADLVTNPNDVVETDSLIQKMMEWKMGGMHIINVIHTRSEDAKARGHLGTFIEEKCETVILCERTDYQKKNDPVKVRNTDSRGPSFDDFYFRINNNALPYEINYEGNENNW